MVDPTSRGNLLLPFSIWRNYSSVDAEVYSCIIDSPWRWELKFPPKCYIHGSVHRESNLLIVQKDATYSVGYFSVGSSTCFGCWHTQLFIQTCQYNGTLITEQNRGEQNPLFQLDIDTGLTSQFFHNKWIPTVGNTWISSNSTTRADGSRSGYVKTSLLISIVLFPKYSIITKSSVHTIVLADFVYCIFR